MSDLIITDEQTIGYVKQLAELTGKSIEDVVVDALQHALDDVHRERGAAASVKD